MLNYVKFLSDVCLGILESKYFLKDVQYIHEKYTKQNPYRFKVSECLFLFNKENHFSKLLIVIGAKYYFFVSSQKENKKCFDILA